MIDRLRPRELARLWRADVPGPVDVLNLLRIERLESYRWYGMLVAPPLAVVRGGPIWMGRLEQALAGEAPADKLLLVRYPSHRRFLAMTLSPYYLAINPLREHGLSGFEASFTHASVSAPGLAKRKRVVGVHFDSELDPLREAGEKRVGRLVYASRETAPIGSILRSPRATDPNPLSRKAFAMFEADEAPSAATLAALQEATTGCEIALYRREPAAAYRPGAPAGPPATRTRQDTSLRISSADPTAQKSTT